jgi:ABC-type nitrate/sulfonate/bicarbonate transport system substrate-binding protein
LLIRKDKPVISLNKAEPNRDIQRYGRRVLAAKLGYAAGVLLLAGFLFIAVRWKTGWDFAVLNTGAAIIEQPKTISLGIQVSPASTLVMVAQDLGLFEQQGIKVDLREFTAGKFALQAFLGGSLDAVVSGELPVLLAAMQGYEINVVTQVVETTVNEIRFVARRDAAEGGPGRFFRAAKRTIATSFGGGPEYFTYCFLKDLGLDASEVTIVSQRPEDMPVALASRSVDAISIFDPFAFFAESQLGREAVVFNSSASYNELYLLSLSPTLLERRPADARALLRALIDASVFTSSNPEAAKRVVSKYTKLDKTTIDAVWSDFVFKPVLTKALLDNWKEELKWLKETGKLAGPGRPVDFEQLIKNDLLAEIDPLAVRLR